MVLNFLNSAIYLDGVGLTHNTTQFLVPSLGFNRKIPHLNKFPINSVKVYP